MASQFRESNRGVFVAHTLKLSVGEYGLERLNTNIAGAIKAEGWLTLNDEGHQIAMDIIFNWDEVIEILTTIQKAGERVRAQIMTGKIVPRDEEAPGEH